MSEKACIIHRNKKKKTTKKETKGKQKKKKHCNRLKKDTTALSYSIHLLYNSANKKSKSIPEFQKWTNIFVQF
jgi:hypothetical protein